MLIRTGCRDIRMAQTQTIAVGSDASVMASLERSPRWLARRPSPCCNRSVRTYARASMPFFTPTTFTTRRLILRPLQPEDALPLFARWSDVDAMRFSMPAMINIDQATDRVARSMQRSAEGTDLICAVTSRATGEVLGDTALFRADERNRHVEIGFGLARTHWGNGYMQEAASALIEHAFTALNVHRIEAQTDPRNAASANLLARLGFVREGLAREHWFIGDEACDSALYGLLQQDRHRASPSTDAR